MTSNRISVTVLLLVALLPPFAFAQEPATRPGDDAPHTVGPTTRATRRVTTRPTARGAGRFEGRPAGQMRPMREGTVVAVGEGSITLFEQADRDVPAGEHTYSVLNETRIGFQQQTAERVSPNGQVTRSYSIKPATLADVEVGMRVTVRVDAERGQALMIGIQSPPPITTQPETPQPETAQPPATQAPD